MKGLHCIDSNAIYTSCHYCPTIISFYLTCLILKIILEIAGQNVSNFVKICTLKKLLNIKTLVFFSNPNMK